MDRNKGAECSGAEIFGPVSRDFSEAARHFLMTGPAGSSVVGQGRELSSYLTVLGLCISKHFLAHDCY